MMSLYQKKKNLKVEHQTAVAVAPYGMTMMRKRKNGKPFFLE